MESSTHSRGKRTTWLMSLVAIAPLLVLAALLVFTGKNNAGFLPLLDAFKTLSAIILSYLGAIRFGMALQTKSLRAPAMAATMIPGIIGWACLFLPDTLSISLLLLSVCALGAWDSFALHGGSGPPWLANIRSVMTVISALAHIAVLLTIL